MIHKFKIDNRLDIGRWASNLCKLKFNGVDNNDIMWGNFESCVFVDILQ
jgi:hypothetical protein